METVLLVLLKNVPLAVRQICGFRTVECKHAGGKTSISG